MTTEDKKKPPGSLARWYDRNRNKIYLTLFLVILFILYFWPNIFISIHSGQAGVLWHRFGDGTDLDKTYEEGLHIIFPWDLMYIYDVRVQEIQDKFVLYSSSGLAMDVHFSARIFLRKNELPHLHQQIGPDYGEKILRPEVFSALRTVLGNYTPEDIYARDEEGLLKEIKAAFNSEIGAHYMIFHDIMLLQLYLPPKLQESIQNKLVHQQQMESYQYILEREKQEKQRRIIEAEGIAAFEKLTGVSILKLRGIEATQAIANSPNSKVILIGPDSGSLPVILNADSPSDLAHKTPEPTANINPSSETPGPQDDKKQEQ